MGRLLISTSLSPYLKTCRFHIHQLLLQLVKVDQSVQIQQQSCLRHCVLIKRIFSLHTSSYQFHSLLLFHQQKLFLVLLLSLILLISFNPQWLQNYLLPSNQHSTFQHQGFSFGLNFYYFKTCTRSYKVQLNLSLQELLSPNSSLEKPKLIRQLKALPTHV